MHTDKLFEKQKKKRIKGYKKDKLFLRNFNNLGNLCIQKKYTYNFNWFGVPIIQYPSDMIVIQELIFSKKPDLIIETGIARAGSLVFYSTILNYINNKARVLGIDIDIRKHARKIISNHKIKNILTIEGSSISDSVKNKVEIITKKYKKILVILDSLHTHDHVFQELVFYSKFIKKNCYIVVCDTTPAFVDDKTSIFIKKNYNYPLTKTKNAKSAIHQFLKINKKFTIDNEFNYRALLTNCIDGYLKRK